jgi:5-methylthioadenosine/S-adenosylhomocysteine deaminase
MDNERKWFPLTGIVPGGGRRAQAAARVAAPIDPLTGPRIALAGRVVTMNDAFEVHQQAVVYVDKGTIVSVQPRAQAPPAEFAGTPVIETSGTIFPGLIELHNHLSYNVLPLWSPVPRRFRHRGEWPNHKDYRPLVSGPMTVIGRYQDATGHYPLLAPLIRYVECKCLLGGVTSTQGVKLASNAGIQRFYRGIVRNVEQTDEPGLPEAQGRIPDLDAKDARNFLSRLQKEDSCFLLHLSEGVTDPANPLSAARKHFLALEVAPDQWALRKVFAGIHSTGLLPQDFDVLARYGCSMVWSPFSNLLLYGGTARVDAARRSGVAIGLGSDWSPTGSKNLLGEMKVAWLHSQHDLNGLFSARDIVAMVTCNAARILKWDNLVGSIERGRRADVIVVAGPEGDPYEALIRAKEPDIRLVMVNGVARYAVAGMMKPWMAGAEYVRVAGERRALFLAQQSGDPDVAGVSLKVATP